MFHIALFEPQIAPNTGNIIRLVANNGCHLHLIEPLGFDLEEKKLRRAGLDYKDLARVSRYQNYTAFEKAMAGRQIYAITTKGSRHYDAVDYQAGDVLLFGAETHGLHPDVMNSISPENRLRIPMQATNRSMNLSNAVALVSYEAWRQQGFSGGQ
ncbi:MAG: tRNA (uridine(34)/cytosine(34)/5-carboxymethylaminomethyluridine(34)-2'-O)-methyltransferase TrmL [Gammaproteobacteria bacterium]|nr:MAG: tRNA (uridine(34)/cytosine(34)/5-carboxymethylaminomethyluridine(34)-2'-O)-methyltransferase TrmL [Gammaproteobacteria bacterium]